MPAAVSCGFYDDRDLRGYASRLDGQAVSAAFGAWLSGQAAAGLADAPSLVIALDGRAVRGARTREGKAPHLLATMITGARAVIAQRDVDVKTNEITQVRPLLDDIGIAGAGPRRTETEASSGHDAPVASPGPCAGGV